MPQDRFTTLTAAASDILGTLFADKSTAFLTLQSVLFTLSLILPAWRDAAVITSPLLSISLPVLTGTMTIVAVLFAWQGKVRLQHNGTRVQVENLPERDLSQTNADDWNTDTTK